MPVENTTRIPREALLEILETEAPAATQRTTAPMPAVTLTDLLCIRDEEPDDEPLAPPPPPVRRMRANTVPAPSRSAVRAVGTDPEIKALAAPKAAVEEPGTGIVIGRVPTAETAPIRLLAPTVFGVPIVSLPEPCERPRRARRASMSDTYDLPPLNAREIADVLDRLAEQPDVAESPDAPPTASLATSLEALACATAASPAPLLVMPAQPPIFVTPVTTLQVRTLRPLVIAVSCLMTLLLALLVSLL